MDPLIRILLALTLLGVAAPTPLHPSLPPGLPFVFSQIDFPGADGTLANAINNAGEIVGTFGDAAVPEAGSYLLAEGAFQELHVPGSTDTLAKGLNDIGQVVGSFSTDGGLTRHGFVLHEGIYSQLDVPGADGTVASAVNNLGQVGGIFLDAGQIRGFLWDPDSGFHTIEVPLEAGGTGDTFVTGINDAGDIVGDFPGIDGSSHGFRIASSPSPILPQFTVIDVPSATDTFLTDITDDGTITGIYLLKGGPSSTDGRGFVFDGSTFRTVHVSGAAGTGVLGRNDNGTHVGFFAATTVIGSCPKQCPTNMFICCANGDCVSSVTQCPVLKHAFSAESPVVLVPTLGPIAIAGFVLLISLLALRSLRF